MTDVVGIVIPAYNCERFVKESIESCFSQTYKNIKIITIDDASIDNTFSVIEKIKDVRCYRNNVNLGASYSRNIGIEIAKESKCNYIQFLDGDDILVKEAIEEKIDLISNEDVGMIYSSYYNMTEDGKILDFEHKPSFDYDRLCEDNYITCLSMHKTKNLIAVGGFDKHLNYCEDWDLALRISPLGVPVYYPKAHFCYRMNKDSQTRKIDWNIYMLDKEIVFKKLMARNGKCSSQDLMMAYNKKIQYMEEKNAKQN